MHDSSQPCMDTSPIELQATQKATATQAQKGLPSFAHPRPCLHGSHLWMAEFLTVEPQGQLQACQPMMLGCVLFWPAGPEKQRNLQAQHIPVRHVGLQREKPELPDKVT
ncbi:unnamed protein product [Effrenium voratum]|uniref:Uncharacterized protein n=1 Tax=Effrenium voratum TaxID=2562239 RepID=A0AA36I561_9DINO|nr:unnamed protein product [Effrenium voratum]